MNKKLHILFLSGWYPSRVSPTNGNFVQHHAEAIATKQNVTVLYLISDISSKKIESEKFNKNNIRTIIFYVPKTNNPLYKLYIFLKIYINEINNLNKIDLIHLNILYPLGLIALYCKFFKNIPFIVTEHWTGYLKSSKIKFSFPKLIIFKLIAKYASFICPVSMELKNAMIDIGIKGNYKVIGNVVDTNIFKPINHKKSTLFTITHVSSFYNEQKNIKGILNVVKKIAKKRSDFIFKIVGDGSLYKLNIQIKKLNIPKSIIQTEGLKTNEEIALLLKHSDLYISFSNYETFGIVMIEALACGIPIISTNTGVVTELKPSEFITIVKKNSEHNLLQSIIKHMDSNTKPNTDSIHNLIKQKFGIENIAKQYSNIYKKSIIAYNQIK